MIHVFVVNKKSSNSNLDCKDCGRTVSVEELHLRVFSVKVFSAIFTSKIFAVHYSTNL